MTLPVPLQVRLTTTAGSRDVTTLLRDLSFRSTSPGGYAWCKLGLDSPDASQPSWVRRFGDLKVVDGRNCQTVWQGLQEDPAYATGADAANAWDVAAIGAAVHAKDSTRPLIYADRGLEPWITTTSTAPYIRVATNGETVAAVEMKVDQGSTWATGDAGIVAYRAIADAGMILARVSAGWDTGFTNTNVEVRLATALDNGTYTVQTSATANTAGGTLAASRGGTPGITAGHNWATLRLIAVTGPITGAETTWGTFLAIAVRSLLKDKTGTDITSGYTLNTVLASEVFADVMARLCPRFDVANATIATTTFGIEQLAFPEGISPYDLAGELLAFEPGHTWHVWEKTSAGLWRIEWVAWPTTTIRYEADAVDGFDSPASAVELFDSVTVAYRDSTGRNLTVRRTQTVQELLDAGISREGYIDLGAQTGSAANATRVGDQFLVEHASPPNRGTLTVKRPIRDLVYGRMVQPWEIRPGQLIKVRGIQPRPDALNPTGIGRDGHTIFRVVANSYTVAEGAVLELDSFARTTARLLTDAQTRRRR